MEVLFMNTLEKRVDDKKTLKNRMKIERRDGIYRLSGQEDEWPKAGGKGGKAKEQQHGVGETEQIWYEGDDWNMLARELTVRTQDMLTQGFVPLFDPYFELMLEEGGKSRHALIHEFYGEEHAVEEVYEKLRVWRRERAKRDGRQPYIIASNALLKMLSAFLPQTGQELAQIPGFGSSRQEQYGSEILKITGGHAPRHSFPLDWINGQIDLEQFRRWVYKRQEERFRSWREREAVRVSLLEGISEGEGLKQLEERSSLGRRELLLQLEELEQSGYELSSWAHQEMGDIPEKIKNTALDLFNREGSRYLKPIYVKLDEQGVWNEEEKGRVYDWLRILRLWHRSGTEVQEA